MATGDQGSNSLIRWMLDAPFGRLFKGVILPLALLFGFIAFLLLVNFGVKSDVVYYNPKTNKPHDSLAKIPKDQRPDAQKRVRITYWEKWSGFEGQAIQDAVNAFNRTQDKIYVELIVQGDITQKTKIATAGGDPPDLAGLYSVDVPVFASQNALVPLDEMFKEAGISERTFVRVYWDLCKYSGKMWAIPSTPSTWALHWNKKLFREAGLNPDRPPRTIQELDTYARRLTKVDENGRLIQVGYLPTEPGWWKYPWALWFGGTLWNGVDRLTFNSPESLKAMKWIASYADGAVFKGVGPKPISYEELDRFKKTAGAFSTSDNAFFSGKVAMEIQGVWMAKFIGFYAPKDFEWGCCPFPAIEDPKNPGKPLLANVTVAEADVIGIPRGAKHVKEAFEFIKFMCTPEGMEILCLGQGKHSPLRKTSESWYREHPHPYIKVFEDLGDSPNCFRIPPIGVWRECAQAWGDAFDDVWTGKKTPQAALDELQTLMQRRLDREFEKLKELGIKVGKDQ